MNEGDLVEITYWDHFEGDGEWAQLVSVGFFKSENDRYIYICREKLIDDGKEELRERVGILKSNIISHITLKRGEKITAVMK